MVEGLELGVLLELLAIIATIKPTITNPATILPVFLCRDSAIPMSMNIGLSKITNTKAIASINSGKKHKANIAPIGITSYANAKLTGCRGAIRSTAALAWDKK